MITTNITMITTHITMITTRIYHHNPLSDRRRRHDKKYEMLLYTFHICITHTYEMYNMYMKTCINMKCNT